MGVNNNVLEKEKNSKNNNVSEKNNNLENNKIIKEIDNSKNKIDVVEKENQNDDKKVETTEKITDKKISISNKNDNAVESIENSQNNNQDSNIELQPETVNSEFKPLGNSKPKSIMTIFTLLVMIVFSIILVIIIGFTAYNFFNTKIVSGVYIKGIDVSNLSKSDAKYQIDNLVSQNLPDEIQLKHDDFIATVSLSQMETQFNTKNAVE